jgi:hypothetical protein
VRFNDAAELDRSLTGWTQHRGRPYGVDIVMPASVPTEGSRSTSTSSFRRAPGVRETHLCGSACRRCPEDGDAGAGVLGWLHSVARSHVDAVLAHPIRLIANALGRRLPT